MMKIEKSKFVIAESISVLIAIVVLIWIFSWFQRSLINSITASTESSLMENTSLYAATFQVKLEDHLAMLESQVRYFEDVDMTDYNAMKQTIMETKGIGEFKRIAVADTAGTTMNYDGKSSGNIMMKDYFKSAVQGQAEVSTEIYLDEDGQEVLILAVPIEQNGKTVGVITGTFDKKILSRIFSIDTFSGNGYVMVIDSQGNIIVSSDNQNKLIDNSNYFDFMKNVTFLDKDMSYDTLKLDIKSGQENVFQYKYGSSERVCVYQPIGVHDWYVISVMPYDVIQNQKDNISVVVFILLVVVAVVMIVFMILIFRGILTAQRMEKTNSRYQMINSQVQSVIFEYDFLTKKIMLNGGTEAVFGEEYETLNILEMEKLFSRLHKDDLFDKQSILDELNSGKDRISSEFRLKGNDNVYYWYRMNGVGIRNENGDVIKFIGNLINADEQIVQEHNLKKMAECDLLTGLLNKMTMENMANSVLAKMDKACIGAFYIMDLDYFKSINDKMGHAMGDKVLCEAANKLALVFSEHDLIARIGGDEFAVLLRLPNQDEETAKRLINSKAKSICQNIKHLYLNGKTEVLVTASVGIATFKGNEEDYQTLYKNADQALYHSKNCGKDQYTFFDAIKKEAADK